MKEDLNFEELGFAHRSEEPDVLELPLSKETFLLVGGSVLLLTILIFGRVIGLNVLAGDFYRDRAASNVYKEVNIPAPRGAILDRFGAPLVENRNSFSVFLASSELVKMIRAGSLDLDAYLAKLGGVLEVDPKEILARLQHANFEKSNLVPVSRDITPQQMIALTDIKLPAVQIGTDYTRDYVDAPVFSHVIGYTGPSEEDSSVVGKVGLEAFYDAELRGKDGSMIAYRDAQGKILDKKVLYFASQGKEFSTTIDAGLQRYFYQRLQSGLASLGRDSGVGLAMNPKTGEILSLISLPSFDNNNLKKYLNAPHQPLFNRAVSGSYNPGSTIKPLVALAALKENLVTPDFSVLSVGYIELPNPFNPDQPSRFVDWKPHGWVNLHSALARSSNVYFYEIGGGFQDVKGLGIERLGQYWRQFLFGVKTGVDLPAEGEGFLPNPTEKEARTGQIWRIGDTYNVSIGQGDLSVTPLQLLNFIGAIANGGKFYQPHLLLGAQPVVLSDRSDLAEEIREVQIGMEDAVSKPYGTANMLWNLPMKAAGKTGSAQVSNNTKTNAFFVGYAPVADPEITVLVLIENAREGSLNAVPIAKDVLDWYYHNRLSSR